MQCGSLVRFPGWPTLVDDCVHNAAMNARRQLMGDYPNLRTATADDSMSSKHSTCSRRMPLAVSCGSDSWRPNDEAQDALRAREQFARKWLDTVILMRLMP